MGYHINDCQLHPLPLKAKVVLNFPELKTANDLQSFVSLSYFQKFDHNYSLIAKTLTELFKNTSLISHRRSTTQCI